MDLTFDKDRYLPGDIIWAMILLSPEEKRRARSVEAMLICEEVRHDKEIKILDRYDLDRQAELGIPATGNTRLVEVTRSKKVAEVAGRIIDVTDGIRIEFIIPDTAPESSLEYGEDNKTTIWRAHVKVDLPMAIDKNAVKEVIIGTKEC